MCVDFKQTEKSFGTLLKSSRGALTQLVGSIVEGTIVAVTKNMVTVDVGLKMNVRFLVNEFFGSVKGPDVSLKVGERLSFHLEQIETADGDILLNYEKAQKNIKDRDIWNTIEDAFYNKKHINGRVLNYVNGGFSVGLGGIVAFLPNNQVVRIKNTKLFVKSFKTFQILKINRSKKNIILSRTAAIESWKKKKFLLST